MKYKLANAPITDNFVENLLSVRGLSLDQIPLFLNPEPSCLSDPEQFENIEAGANLLLENLNNNKNIWFVVDCDVDGYTSASILWLYIKRIYPDANLNYIVHEQKQHGLNDIIDWLEENHDKIDLMIVPDAGSNDEVEFDRLWKVDIPCLILDHHQVEGEVSDKAIIINNQSSPKYPNKELTGAGVVFQFCRFLDKKLGYSYADQYIDLAALGIISDMGSVLNLENRYITHMGLTLMNKNRFFQALLDKQDYSIGSILSPTKVAWYITPLINALIRVGGKEDKEKLFEAFITPDQIVCSTKRGEKGCTETLSTQMVRTCVNSRTQQNKIKDTAVMKLESKIKERNLLDNKVLFLRLDPEDDFPATLNGLVAMQLADRYKHPTIVARRNTEGLIRGSARGLNESELRDFKGFLQSIGLFEYTMGHDNAFGVSIKNDDLPAFHAKANEALDTYNFNEDYYDVNFIYSAKQDGEQIQETIYALAPLVSTYGQMNSEPIFAIPDLSFCPQTDMQVMGRNNDTLKIVKNGVVYMKFFAKDLINDLYKYKHVRMEIIGKSNINHFNGKVDAQIFIDKYSIIDDTLEF